MELLRRLKTILYCTLVIREGPIIADVYIDISPFYGMAPATVSGYRSGGRRYA